MANRAENKVSHRKMAEPFVFLRYHCRRVSVERAPPEMFRKSNRAAIADVPDRAGWNASR